MALKFSARELMDAFATPAPAPRAAFAPFSSAVLAASPAPAAFNIPVRELMDAFTSVPLAPIVCPPAAEGRRLLLTPRADGTTVDGHLLQEYFDSLESPLSVQVVHATAEQLEEEEISASPAIPMVFPEEMFPEDLCETCNEIAFICNCNYTLPPGINHPREYCDQCGGNIFECHCDDGEEEEEESDELHCDLCKWQDIVNTSTPRALRARGFDKCFCEVLIEHGHCSHCMEILDDCACDRCDHCGNVECKCIPDDTVGFSKKSDDW